MMAAFEIATPQSLRRKPRALAEHRKLCQNQILVQPRAISIKRNCASHNLRYYNLKSKFMCAKMSGCP